MMRDLLKYPSESERDLLAKQPAAMAAVRTSIAEKIARWAICEGDFETAIPGLSLNRRIAPSPPIGAVYKPSVAFIVQGETKIVLGNEEYLCCPCQHLVTAVDLPTVHQILTASTERPFLSLMLALDLQVIAEMLVNAEVPASPISPSGRGMMVSDTSLPLLDAIDRLLDLLNEPENIPTLAPLIQKEILYRLMKGELGLHLRQITMVGSQSHRIAKAIALLKVNYMSPLRMDRLAESLSMGLSTFNHHFRALTSMSPLQFQKQLRLHEARRLMLVEHMDAASVAHQVGYESPSQFSREYRRLFGAPPLRDILQLKNKLL